MKYKSLLLVIASFFCLLTVSAETFHLTRENSCFFRGTCEERNMDADGRPASPQAVSFVNQILSKISLTPKLKIYGSDLHGEVAVAMVSLSNRIILVDEKHISKIRADMKSNWPSVFIIAHECAHQINSLPTSKDEEFEGELAADKFAGYLLHKLGAPRSQTIAALNAIDEKMCSEHPPKAQRINAAIKGWQQAEDEKQTKVEPGLPEGYAEFDAVITEDFKVKIIETPIDFNPSWDLVEKSIPINFSVENHVASRPINSNNTWNVQLGPYNGEVVVWFNAFVTCNCIATLDAPSNTVITEKPQSFRLRNFRKLAGDVAGGPCMGLNNMYFAGGWSGDISLSVNRKGVITMDLEFRAFRTGGGISYRYIANGIQGLVNFVPSRK